MRRLLLAIAIVLTALYASAQEWSIRYTGDYPSGSIHFSDGIIDDDGVTFFVGREGPNREHPEAVVMRVEPNGDHIENKYHKTGCFSHATCIVELPNHNLFVAGNLADSLDDFIMVLILDKQLNILNEITLEKEVDALSFGTCRATLDSHGNVIVSTTVRQPYNAYTTTDHGVFYKFNDNGDLLSHRYLIEDYPDPVYYLFNFHLRQMWYRDETLLCLALASGGVMSFITFDSAFNYIEEYPILRDDGVRSDQMLYDDAYTDHWYNDEEALFFSSRGDYDHNDLRISRINTQGEFLDYIYLTETPDTIYYTAQHRNMATVNDSLIYYGYDYHTRPLYPGISGVFLFNDQLEIIGNYLFDDCLNYRSAIILPTADKGCIVVNHHSPYEALELSGIPIITKLNRNDFSTPSLLTPTTTEQLGDAYPNPASTVLNIPLECINNTPMRCQVIDSRGLVLMDRIINSNNNGHPLLQLDVSSLKQGLYYYRIYSAEKTLLSKKFIKQ